ncbi:FLAVIN-CONTAINING MONOOXYGENASE [Salix purpurea]|uniref:indole-3-pyruvate monooxygenase n=1 Tax=Salix purpurea TaxID=77065 RepID=A0A9Q0WYR5_SALPP|nr:FLAVIN-CONTAINING MONOOXYGENASE [Salix purpurea]
MEAIDVVIVGAGPSGLATSACLNRLSIPNIVLEREDCYASLWQKRAYDRLKLHLAKEYCQLPFMAFPSEAPTFVPRRGFIDYLHSYVSHFRINPRCSRSVESAYHDEETGKWHIRARNVDLNVHEEYAARFLVVATGENSRGFIPEVSGLDSFGGEFIHSSKYEKGQKYRGKDVLVVGCGNSGMEIAYDLSNWGARTSIVARSPVHVLSTNIVYIGMRLLGFGVPCKIVDFIVVLLSKLKHGDISKYGLPRPSEGPFYVKQRAGRTPTIDVGTVEKIRRKEVQASKEAGSSFANGEIKRFDAIIFATGYKSTVRHWLKGGQDLFDESGMPKLCFPNIWKGKNGLYCSGFARRGLFGISVDSQNIAKDIDLALKSQ